MIPPFTTAGTTTPPLDNEIRVAFLGNSILYFNDCPRVLECMLETKYSSVKQNSCLRGGTCLKELWTQGNGMSTKFASPKSQRDNGTFDIGASSVQALLLNDDCASWNYCVLNDYTQGPAREESRQEAKVMLERCYAPLFDKCGATPVVLQTAAYRKPIRNTRDLGTVEEWTQRLDQGCREYVHVLKEALPSSQAPRYAPVGNAFLQVHDTNHDMWEKLFYTDDFHPSPHGTWLQACVLYCVMVGEAPPTFTPSFWDKARYMQRVKKEALPLPTAKEAAILREYACNEFGIAVDK